MIFKSISTSFRAVMMVSLLAVMGCASNTESAQTVVGGWTRLYGIDKDGLETRHNESNVLLFEPDGNLYIYKDNVLLPGTNTYSVTGDSLTWFHNTVPTDGKEYAQSYKRVLHVQFKHDSLILTTDLRYDIFARVK